MKKIVLVVLLIGIMAVVLAGCSGSATPYSAWADEEVLEYKITNNLTGENVGTMTMTTVRNPSDKTLDGKEYASADGKVVIDLIKDGVCSVHTELLTLRYSVLATHKEYTDLADASKSYVLKAYHSGKNYFYSFNDGEEKKLKVGASGYADSEYIYHYIRCYTLSSPPSSVKVPDPLNDTVLTVSCSAYANWSFDVPYPTGTKNANCTVVAISLSSAPKGKPILAAFTPEGDAMSELSQRDSMKMPAQIVENDLTYTVTSMHAN